MAFLKAFGRYVPSRVVSNAELAARLGCEADWILNVSGIEERRYAEPAETLVDMAERAAVDCLKAGPKIGMVIVSSGSSERRFPGPAAEVASRLGLAGIPAIDVPMASAGSLFALTMAGNFTGTCSEMERARAWWFPVKGWPKWFIPAFTPTAPLPKIYA
jgi:3-oxoacyl-[acyl-carrier-protein] synthase-3